MFINLLRRFLPYVALLWVLSAGAVDVSGLYSAELDVDQTGVPPSSEQIEAGLEQVLIRLGGRNAVSSQAAFDEMMRRAPDLLREYRYLAAQGGAQTLQLSYDGRQLDALLQEKGIGGEGQQRPALLLWLVLKQAGEAEDYIPGDHEALKALVAQAQLRGLALSQPLLDLQDLAQLPPEDLWQLAPDQVARASRRYGTEAVLAGRLWSEGGEWFSEFEFFVPLQADAERPDGAPEAQHFTPAGDLTEQMTEIVDQVADRLPGAAREAPTDYRPGGLVLQVEGVASQADYLGLVDRLRHSDGVTAVFPERLSQGHLQLRLQLNTGIEQLEETLRLYNRLEPVRRTDAVGADEAGVLRYRWQN